MMFRARDWAMTGLLGVAALQAAGIYSTRGPRALPWAMLSDPSGVKKPAPGPVFSPKGWHSIAQGNALGTDGDAIPQAEGLRQPSPGQRPGSDRQHPGTPSPERARPHHRTNWN